MRRQYSIIHTMWFSDTRTSLLCCFLKIKGRITGNPRHNANNKKTEKIACLRAGQSRPWVAKPLLVEPGQMRCSTHQSSSAGALSKRVLNWSQACWCAAVPIWTAWNTEIGTRIYDLAFSHNRCDPTSWKLLSFSAKARVLPLPSIPQRHVGTPESGD